MSSLTILNDRVTSLVAMQDEPAPRQFTWREDMPKQCPPEEAHCSDGMTFLRFVKRDPEGGPVTPLDFIQPRDLPRKQPIPDEEMCQHSALSVLKEIEDVPIMRSFVPGFKKKRVAAGAIMPEHGLIQNTPQPVKDPSTGSVHIVQSHYNWWIPVDVTPHAFFKVIPA